MLISDKKTRPPSLRNWVSSIKAVARLWKNLKAEGFKFLSIRNLNQDALENFFAVIRAHGIRNVNPTCSAFRDAFKTCILNNFLSPHSPSANCEVDESAGILDSLKDFASVKIC